MNVYPSSRPSRRGESEEEICDRGECAATLAGMRRAVLEERENTKYESGHKKQWGSDAILDSKQFPEGAHQEADKARYEVL